MGRRSRHADQIPLFEPPPQPPAVGPAEVSERIRSLGAALPEGIHLGTSTWSFPGWSGIVYDRPAPASVLSREGLSAYSQHPVLRGAGIDRTFYQPLSAEEYRRYAEQVPDGFRFVVKAHEQLTLASFPDHPRHGALRGQPSPHFLDPAYARDAVIGPTLKGLGARAGPIVFQFSPQPALASGPLGQPRRFAEALHRFLAALPRDAPAPAGPGQPGPRPRDAVRPLYAVEIRTRHLLSPAYGEALADLGVAHCLSHHPTMPDVRAQAEATLAVGGPALVGRWMLRRGLGYQEARRRFAPFDRLVDEDPETREAFAELLVAAHREGIPAFVTLNNKAEGSAPRSVEALAAAVVARLAAAPSP